MFSRMPAEPRVRQSVKVWSRGPGGLRTGLCHPRAIGPVGALLALSAMAGCSGPDFVLVPDPFELGRRIRGYRQGTIRQYDDPKTAGYIGADQLPKSRDAGLSDESRYPRQAGRGNDRPAVRPVHPDRCRSDRSRPDRRLYVGWQAAAGGLPLERMDLSQGCPLCPGAPANLTRRRDASLPCRMRHIKTTT
jgi:hypothetical protein